MRTGLEASISQFVGHQKIYIITVASNNTDTDQARVIIDDVPSEKKNLQLLRCTAGIRLTRIQRLSTIIEITFKRRERRRLKWGSNLDY